MSIAALRWAFQLEMRDPTAKAVLIALADHANDDGKCWPSVARLCLFTSLADRTVRRALRRLSAEGLITLVERSNQTSVVTLPVTLTAPARSERPPSPVAVTPPPVTVTPEPSRAPSEPPGEPSSARGRAATKEHVHVASSEPRGTRLAADWRPDAAERHYARERGLDPDRIAEEFRNYWCAVPGARGRKLDWPATFRNRCLQRAGREGLARGGDGVVAAAERVLQRRGLGLA